MLLMIHNVGVQFARCGAWCLQTGAVVGCISLCTSALVQDRYASLINDPDTPPFHYGSHYSSAGALCLCSTMITSTPTPAIPVLIQYYPALAALQQWVFATLTRRTGACLLQASCSSTSFARSRGPSWRDPSR